MSGATVISALRKFLPAYQEKNRSLPVATNRAIWAITHCRKPVMGGHLYTCDDCSQWHYACHSCNHRSCPQCGRAATAQWVERELAKRVGAPYFMVTFTLPAELRPLFFGSRSKEIYDLFFTATSRALAEKLAKDKALRAQHSGFTGVLHTWNQRLGFHPHIHYIVPGAGIDADGSVVSVKNANFLVHLPLIRQAFRWHFARELETRRGKVDIDPRVWKKDWGVHIKSFGNGANAIKYLGTYVCRSVISDPRILHIDDHSVTFRWKDRAHQDRIRTDTIPGVEFVNRYLRHVLPRGLRAIRYFGFCHPAAKARRERIAFHTGNLLRIGPSVVPATDDNNKDNSTAVPSWPQCPCCQRPMTYVQQLHPSYGTTRAPPPPTATLHRTSHLASS